MSTFYNKFKEEEKQKEFKEQLFKEQNFNSNAQPIIIQNKSTFKSLIRFLISAFVFCTKGVFYIGIMIFASIGATVILNESLRNTFIEFMKNVI